MNSENTWIRIRPCHLKSCKVFKFPGSERIRILERLYLMANGLAIRYTVTVTYGGRVKVARVTVSRNAVEVHKTMDCLHRTIAACLPGPLCHSVLAELAMAD